MRTKGFCSEKMLLTQFMNTSLPAQTRDDSASHGELAFVVGRTSPMSAAAWCAMVGTTVLTRQSISALHIALGGLPGKMRVEADPDIGVSASRW